MADVQLEHGHIRIANALWEAWFRADLSRNELRVLGAIVRLSYGWGRKDTSDAASYKRLQAETGLGARAVADGVKGLLRAQVVVRVREGVKATNTSACYAPNKDYQTWSPGVLPGQFTPTSTRGSTLLPSVEVAPTSTGGSHLETENKNQTKNPPKPPQGGASNLAQKRKRAAAADASEECRRIFDRWKALQADAGFRRTMKAFPAGWGVQARIDEHGEAEVLAVVEWAHLARDERAERLREGGYLAATLFRPSKFAEYQGLAAKWQGGAGKDWLKEWGGAFRRFVEDVERGDRSGGRDAFVAWLPSYNRKALPVPGHVLDLVDRRTAA